MAGHGSDGLFAKLGYLSPVRIRGARPPGSGGVDLLRLAGLNDGSLDLERSHRRMLLGRLAAVFYAGSGVLGLVTLPLPAPEADRRATAVIAVVALAAGWIRIPR